MPALHAQAQDERKFNNALCQAVQGETEVKHKYSYGDGQPGYVFVDCETQFHVIEGGLDKRSSLDSLQQALFFSVLTRKEPVVVIYDTDGKTGRYEHRIREACEKAGVLFLRLSFGDTSDPAALPAALGGNQPGR